MKDIVNSFKAHLYDRSSSPLIGAFIFYWIICNYKFIMIIFDSDMKLSEKFELLIVIYPQEKLIVWNGFEIYYQILLGNGFLIPLIISLLYLFIAPYPSKVIYKFWKEKQKELQEIKQKIDDEIPLTKEESKKIKQDFFNLELKYYEQLDVIQNLKKSNPEIKDDSSLNLNELFSIERDIKEDKEVINVLSIINDNKSINYGVVDKYFPNLYKMERFNEILEILEHYNLIKYDSINNDLTITLKGSRYIKQINNS